MGIAAADSRHGIARSVGLARFHVLTRTYGLPTDALSSGAWVVMRVLITGGCGFVGANLVSVLTRLGGWTIRVLDNESLGKREHLEDFRGEFVKGDLRDEETVDRCVKDVDAVVHLAADTRVIDSIENPRFNFDVNVAGTLNILEAMRRHRKTKLVNASTGGAIIGHAVGPVNESMVPAPIAPYGAAKLAVEGYCGAYSACYGVTAVSLRFSNVFGPRSFHKGSVVAAFFKNMLAGRPLTVFGDGTQVRDYVCVRDICAGIVGALNRDLSGPIQLGSGRPTELNALIDLMREVTQLDPVVDYQPPRVGEIHSTYCDVSWARAQLGYQPTEDVTTALAETWQWFLERKAHDEMQP